MNLRIAPSPNRAEGLLRALRTHMSRTEVQPGCLWCRISRDKKGPDVILYEEEWDSWEDLGKNIQSDRFARILHLMETSAETPELNFTDSHETRGMEYVQKLRMANKN